MSTHGLFDQLAATLAAGHSAVWVTIVATRGSTPREAGACMLVDAGHSHGTIGGGRLELQALDIARDLLTQAGAAMPAPSEDRGMEYRPPESRGLESRRLESFVLAERCGQGCGGSVELAFDLLQPAAATAIAAACAQLRAGMDWQAAVDGLLQPAAVLAGTPADTLQVLLYGAGHVGRALVEVLGRLPVAIRWIDHRPDAFPATVPPNTACVPCAEPAAAVGAEAAGAAVLIMTPEHGLDLALTRLWLQRGDFRFLGVIGSQHKRRQFAALLRRQGVDEAMLSRLVCPIGLGPVGGKEPEVIAVAVAAQLMQLRRLPHAQGASPDRDPGSTNT